MMEQADRAEGRNGWLDGWLDDTRLFGDWKGGGRLD